MKICIITVDHGKPALTSALYSSILNQTEQAVEIVFVALENSGKVSKDDYLFLNVQPQNIISSKVHFADNDGYFGTASNYLKNNDFDNFDWIIVCNNDLSFQKDFLLTLNKRQSDISNRYLVCPSVIERNCDINPLSRNKYPESKKLFWDFYYKHRTFASFYEFVRLPISKTKFYVRSIFKSKSNIEGEIYLGYGAIYLINPIFISRLGGLPAETFLYQEESVICGYARNFDNWPYFLPSLKVNHDSHATLKFIGFDRDYELRRESWWATRKFLS